MRFNDDICDATPERFVLAQRHISDVIGDADSGRVDLQSATYSPLKG